MGNAEVVETEKALAPVQKQKVELRKLLEQAEVNFGVMLPDGVSPKRLVQAVMNAVMANGELLRCDRQSVMRCAMQAAEWGLMPGTSGAMAHIVPFKGQAVLIPDYKGLIDLALRHGVVRKIEAHVVYERDTYDCELGTAPKLVHKPPPLGEDRGQPIGVYAVAWLPGGDVTFEPMSKAETDAIKARSPSVRAFKPGPWFTDEPEMMRKTAIKRLMKRLPKSDLLNQVVAQDNAFETGEGFETAIDVPVVTLDSVTAGEAADYREHPATPDAPTPLAISPEPVPVGKPIELPSKEETQTEHMRVAKASLIEQIGDLATQDMEVYQDVLDDAGVGKGKLGQQDVALLSDILAALKERIVT
jgi:recombination protein RecT